MRECLYEKNIYMKWVGNRVFLIAITEKRLTKFWKKMVRKINLKSLDQCQQFVMFTLNGILQPINFS